MPKVHEEESAKLAFSTGPWLAINLFDLDRVDSSIRSMLLGGLLDLKAIRVDKHRMDTTAVAFKCDLLRAATICDIIRGHDEADNDPITRVYLKKATVWEQIPSNASLTEMRDGKSVLNRELLGLPSDVIADDEDHRPKQLKR